MHFSGKHYQQGPSVTCSYNLCDVRYRQVLCLSTSLLIDTLNPKKTSINDTTKSAFEMLQFDSMINIKTLRLHAILTTFSFLTRIFCSIFVFQMCWCTTSSFLKLSFKAPSLTLLINLKIQKLHPKTPQSYTSYTRRRRSFCEVKQCFITIDSSPTEFKMSQHHATVINVSLSVCLPRSRG